MHTNGQPLPPRPGGSTGPHAPPPAGGNTARRITLFVLGFLAVPVALIFLVFPFLSDEPFATVDELAPQNIASLRVSVVNRAELDGGEDVGPYLAAEADFAALLAPLKSVPEVEQFPNARGPWLGEYRVMTREGRRGRVRFYWVRDPHAPDVPPRLRFQVGERKFEGGRADALVKAAEAAKDRGTPTR